MNLIADLLFFASALALGYAATLLFVRLPFFPLRELVVDGSLKQVTPTQIEYAARHALQGNFLTVNVDAARAAFEKLPWVRRAQVRRRWPNALELEIEEHVAVARWQQGQDVSRLVNRQGEVFAAASDEILPLLSGPQGSSPQVLARYAELQPLLAQIERRPDSVSLSAREAWQVRLDDGVVLDLGRDEAKSRIDERLQRFVSAYRSMREQLKARPAVYDLRYPNGFAVRLAHAGDGKS